MAHYAKVNDEGIVETVIVADADYIETLEGTWIQTSYNTIRGVHTNGGIPLRYNYAGIGDVYDAELDVFRSPQPYPSWTMDAQTYDWVAPVEYPDDGNVYEWNEETTNWVVTT